LPIIGIREISVILLSFSIVFAQNIEKSSNLFFDYETFSYPARVKVLPKSESVQIGVSGDTWILDFGQIYVGMGSRKYINVTVDEQYKVMLKSSGNISSMLRFEKNNFIVEKGNVAIPVYVEPKNPGFYDGELKIVFKKVKYNFLNWLLKCV
jgi:hypothetical protein